MKHLAREAITQTVKTCCAQLYGKGSLIGHHYLGHASVAFTMDVYSHIIDGMQEDAMALLDEVLPAGINGVSQKNNAKLTPISPVM